jgi:hypothetical protein
LNPLFSPFTGFVKRERMQLHHVAFSGREKHSSGVVKMFVLSSLRRTQSNAWPCAWAGMKPSDNETDRIVQEPDHAGAGIGVADPPGRAMACRNRFFFMMGTSRFLTISISDKDGTSRASRHFARALLPALIL